MRRFAFTLIISRYESGNLVYTAEIWLSKVWRLYVHAPPAPGLEFRGHPKTKLLVLASLSSTTAHHRCLDSISGRHTKSFALGMRTEISGNQERLRSPRVLPKQNRDVF
jgi:hypothetical protein